jgi:glyoxylase I family protein
VPELQGVGHIVLTVTDPERSADFYNQLFDAQTILTVEDEIGPLTICVSPAMMFGFRTHPSTGEADRFDPARVGLDHLGFHVARQAAAGGLAGAARRAGCHQLRDHRG